MILEIADGAAHGTVGHAQLVGRSGKAQVAGSSLEARQRIQGREGMEAYGSQYINPQSTQRCVARLRCPAVSLVANREGAGFLGSLLTFTRWFSPLTCCKGRGDMSCFD